MRALRSRITYANVAATLALFFALTGVGYAATQLAKNSVGAKQLKANSVTTAKIKKGAVTSAKLSEAAKLELKGAPGAKGDTGPAGPTGPQGPAGGFSEALPSGKTERGTYANGGTVPAGAGFEPVTSISFPFPLSFAPQIVEVAIGGPSTKDCPGTIGNPQAAPGVLCVYQGRNEGKPVEVKADVTDGRYGVSLYAAISPGADWEIYGSWAVTAP